MCANFSDLKAICQQVTEFLVTDKDFAKTTNAGGSLANPRHSHMMMMHAEKKIILHEGKKQKVTKSVECHFTKHLIK